MGCNGYTDADCGFIAGGAEGFHLGLVGADELHHLAADLGSGKVVKLISTLPLISAA